VGVGQSRTAVSRLIPVFDLCSLAKSGPAADAFGVGHKPDSLPKVRSANVGSGDNVPLAYIPDRGKRPQESSKRAASIMTENANGIFRHKEPWLEIRNNSECFAPHPSLIAGTFFPSGNAYGLTRNASAYQINVPIRWLTKRKRANVAPSRDVRPVLGEHASRVVVNLDLPPALHASTLKPEVKAANPRE